MTGSLFASNALIGSSLDRHYKRFSDLQLGESLTKKKTTPMCGLFVVDLADLSIAHKLELKGSVHEIYDICVVPGKRARTFDVNSADGRRTFKKNNK